MNHSEEAVASLLRVADAVGGLMEFWGFKRNMGRMWTLLYMRREPVPAAELASTLSLSSGAVSMTLSELVKWGTVKKSWRPGDRKDYFEAETNIWKMVSRVFRERELRQIEVAIEAFESAIATLDADSSGAKGQAQDNQFALERIRSLLELARLGHSILGALLEGNAIDTSAFRLFGNK
jgi:DNA-binding transcriptional regulator GbsR (MarR family)